MEASGKRVINFRSKTDEFKVYNIADVHGMAKACAVEVFEADVAAIKSDDKALWLGGGDYVDYIGYDDKRFDPDSVADGVPVKALGDLGKHGMEWFASRVDCIKDKCLGLLLGNHEKQFQLKNKQESLHGWLCTQLDVPNLQYSALFDIVFTWDTMRKAFRIYCHHGAGYATTPGGKLNKLIQFMSSFNADIYFCGHVHDKVARREPSIGADRNCTKLEAHEKIGVVSGSYLKTYAQGCTTYGEQRGYRPVSLGAAWVAIKPFTREFRAEI